jgi:indolepyruvate ferredoxin oxidoreductase beta subunit
MPVVTGAAKYPENIIEDIEAKGAKVLTVDALELATKAGNKKAVNVVLLGVMAKKLVLKNRFF